AERNCPNETTTNPVNTFNSTGPHAYGPEPNASRWVAPCGNAAISRACSGVVLDNTVQSRKAATSARTAAPAPSHSRQLTRFGLGSRIRSGMSSGARPLHDQLPDTFRVRLTLGSLHHGTDDGTRGLYLAAPDLLHDIGLCGQRLVNGGQQRGIVRYDLHATLLDHHVRLALTCQHRLYDVTGQLVRQLTGAHQFEYSRELHRSDRQIG